ncbi:hypothetical protein DWV16_16340 [Anaerotruncus sp. AF02-27]|uniref:hypothetical protein n=1 Tax=Anaerotruncus TaxID=244127 RepID=UPI000E48622B|nr:MULTISPECIES: hypothetical protein [Anaerotruncus]RGX53792.1 hypothetical protein DWV16_16340 [Anaerotruncus sp. AF02-27]
MLEFVIKLDASPALIGALDKLTAAFSRAPEIHTPKPAAINAPEPIAAAPVVSIPVAAPAAAPAPAVPVTAAPAYTVDQLSQAGAALVDAGKMDALMGLLSKYAVQAITQLPPEQYGAFATDLRGLGARI